VRLLALFVLALWPRAAQDDPVAAELALRAALHARRLELAPVDADWRARVRAIEGHERRARAGDVLEPEVLAAARSALADGHPNVRARALALLAAAGGEVLPAESLARALREELAFLRLALASALDTLAAPGRAAALLELAFDVDERVRRAARASLCGLDPGEDGVLSALEALAGRVAAEEEVTAFARLCEALKRSGLGTETLALLRRAAHDETRAALVEAMAFAARLDGDPAAVVRGLVRLDDARWDAAHASVLVSAGRARDVRLARAVAPILRAGADGPSEGVRRALFVASLPRATAWSELAALEPASPWLAELVSEVADALDGLDAEVLLPWLAPERPPALRAALVSAAAATFARLGEAGSERVLVRALADPEPGLAWRAFAALAGARELGQESAQALLTAWLALAPERQLEALAECSRARPWPAFRVEWLARGAREPAARAALAELLAPLGPDPEAGAELERWLIEDGRGLGGSAEVTRELEQRLQAELRALARLAPERVEPFDLTLRRALGHSTEVGKLAVAGLGRSAAGRARLALHLASGSLAHDFDRRTRIEAGIQLALAERGAARAAPRAQLLAERENAAWDLRERVLEALGAAGDEADLAALGALLLAPETEPVERTFLATLLGGAFGERAAPYLFALLRTPHELEARRAALRALGGFAQSGAGLGAFLDGLAAGGASDDEQLVLRGEALVALARVQPADPRLGAAWLAAPHARAAADLAARLAGRELSSVEFAWRAELEVARHLAVAGRLRVTLEASGAWWNLDGRLLTELGRMALDAEPRAAGELLRAALVARLGERDPELRELARLHALLARLAREARAPDALMRQLAPLRAARLAGRLGESTWSELARLIDPGTNDPDEALRLPRGSVR